MARRIGAAERSQSKSAVRAAPSGACKRQRRAQRGVAERSQSDVRYKGTVSDPSIVEVAVPVPIDETFEYALDEGARAEPGARVLVPHGGRRIVGGGVATRSSATARTPGPPRPRLPGLADEPVVAPAP